MIVFLMETLPGYILLAVINDHFVVIIWSFVLFCIFPHFYSKIQLYQWYIWHSMLASDVPCLELVDSSWLCGCVSPTSALRHRLPCMLHPDLTTHTRTHTHYHAALHVHIGMCFTWLHARERSNTYRTSVHKNTHMRRLFQTLAVGMALCTNTPTFTHPFNLRAQKPRVTTSLSAVKPRNYDKPLSMFILPFLTMHYPHHPPLPSNLRWSHF